MSMRTQALFMAPIVALLLAALAAPSLAARVDLKGEAATDALEFKSRSLLQTYGTPLATFPDLPTALNALSTQGFNTLATLINQTGIGQSLTGNYIILAPTDIAFQVLNETVPGAPAILANQTAVAEILAYHVIPTQGMNQQLNTTSQVTLPTAVPPGTFMNASTNITVKNISLVEIDDLPSYYVGGVPYGAFVNLTTYVTAGGSTIYPIESVLLPPAKELLGQNYSLTILEAAQGVPELSTLVQLAASEPDVLAVVSDPDTAVTLLAPSNTAIENALALLNLTPQQALGSPLLRRILLNHVAIIPLDPSNFQQGQILVPTLATYENVTDSLNVTVTGNDGTNGPVATVVGPGNAAAGLPAINVTGNPVLAGKSAIWAIDGVVLPAIDLTSAGNYTAPPPSNSTPSPPPGVAAPPPPTFTIPGAPGSNGNPSPPPAGGAATLPTASLLVSAAAGMLALLALI